MAEDKDAECVEIHADEFLADQGPLWFKTDDLMNPDR